MRKSIFQDKKTKPAKKKDKKMKTKIEKSNLVKLRWSQDNGFYSPRFGSMNSQKGNYSNKNIPYKSTSSNFLSKIQHQKNTNHLSGSCSPQKHFLLQKCHNKFSTTNATPKRKSLKHEFEKLQGKNIRKNFKFIYQIGFGGFGRVWKVYDRKGDADFAMKEISKRKVIEKNSVDCIMNEKKFLASLEYPFLINISQTFQDENNLYLVMDYLRGADLRYHICYKDFFTQNQTKFIIACIILALEYIHSRKIIHRDIKPQNLVFEDNGYLRLTDFGVAIFCRDMNFALKDSSGTPGYMAPQILFRKQYTYTSDFFAIGIIGYELMKGKRPYQGKCRKQIKEKMQKESAQIYQREIPPNWNPHAADFINRLLISDPAERLGGKEGIKELKKHKWMKSIDWQKLEKKQVTPPFIPHVICETKDYLDEIILYNEMKQEKIKQNMGIKLEEQILFEGYEYNRGNPLEENKKWRKLKKSSQQRIL